MFISYGFYDKIILRQKLGVIQMSTKQLLLKEIEALSPSVAEEVLHFITLLKVKNTNEHESNSIHYASEASLAVDWLLPEEDEVWANL
jgi:hypothetical protein